MKYIAKIAIVLFTFWLAIPTVAQTPKKEVRAFWLSTVWRLTWPKTTVISNTGNAQEIQEQKDELIMLLGKSSQCQYRLFPSARPLRCDV